MLGIYRKPGRYVVRKWEDYGEEALWALLGSAYTREKAQKLADLLTEELIEIKSLKRSLSPRSGRTVRTGSIPLTPIAIEG